MTTTRAALVPHPETPCAAVRSLGVQAALSASGRLQLGYVLLADLDRLALAEPAPQRFRDGLWRHTCFEAFVAPDGAARYFEINVAPSREWAAYSFVNQRQGMARLEQVVPRVDVRAGAGRLEVQVGVELASLIEPPWRALQLGLAAVVEARDGAHSYWALRHAAERPDFHRRESFVLTLS